MFYIVYIFETNATITTQHQVDQLEFYLKF